MDHRFQQIDAPRKDLHSIVERMAFRSYLRTGQVPLELRRILVMTESLEALEKHNPNWPSQPRAPSGQPNGGQWTDGGAVGENPSAAPPDQGEIDDPPLEPVYPVEEILLTVFGGRGVVAVARRAIISSGIFQNRTRDRINGDVTTTEHAAERLLQRSISEGDINTAVETAKRSGQISEKLGKYGTLQRIYTGKNGVTVVVETEGRNAGKVITAYRP